MEITKVTGFWLNTNKHYIILDEDYELKGFSNSLIDIQAQLKKLQQQVEEAKQKGDEYWSDKIYTVHTIDGGYFRAQ